MTTTAVRWRSARRRSDGGQFATALRADSGSETQDMSRDRMAGALSPARRATATARSNSTDGFGTVVLLFGLFLEADGEHALALCSVLGGARDDEVLLSWMPRWAVPAFSARFEALQGGKPAAPATDAELEAWSAYSDSCAFSPAVEGGWAGERP